MCIVVLYFSYNSESLELFPIDNYKMDFLVSLRKVLLSN